jgi:hypothetical protein
VREMFNMLNEVRVPPTHPLLSAHGRARAQVKGNACAGPCTPPPGTCLQLSPGGALTCAWGWACTWRRSTRKACSQTPKHPRLMMDP